jgi:signal transduction histidine kinase
VDSKLFAAVFALAAAAAGAAAGFAAGRRRPRRPAAPLPDDERIAWLQRLSTIGQMMSGVVHEVRTPLNTVILNVELAQRLLDRGENPRDRLVTAVTEADRAVDILSDILDFAKPSPLDLQPLELKPLLEGALGPLLSRFDERGVKTSLSAPAGLRALASERHFQQVLTILLLNSLDALPFGGSVRIDAQREGGLIKVVVRDNGLGIEPEILARLFQPFATGHPESGGTGLGLNVARWLMAKHGGEVAIASEGLGRGTTVTLTLQVAA